MDIGERRRKLGANIKFERIRLGISQRSFAKMIGVSQAYLSSVENGEKNIGFNNLCKIADGLGLPIGNLTDDDLSSHDCPNLPHHPPTE